jgi:hypothetical protein
MRGEQREIYKPENISQNLPDRVIPNLKDEKKNNKEKRARRNEP